MYPSGITLTLLALCLSLTGCASWRLETQGAAEVVASKDPEKIRVEGPQLRRTVLYRPTVQGDSLVGCDQWNPARRGRAVALSDVTSVATSRVDAGKTVGLALGAAFGLAALVAVATYDGPFDGCCQ